MALGLAALAGPATAQTRRPQLRRRPTPSTPAASRPATSPIRFRQTGATYTATANREMKGWVGAALNRSQDYTYSVRGTVAADGTLRPSAYQHQGGRRRDDRPNGRLVRATFTRQ